MARKRQHGSGAAPHANEPGSKRRTQPPWYMGKLSNSALVVFIALCLLIGLIFHLTQGNTAGVAKAKHSSETSSDDGDNVLMEMNTRMQDAENVATGEIRSAIGSRLWLESALAMYAKLAEMGAPSDVQSYVLSELERIVFSHMRWNDLLADQALLLRSAPALVARMASPAVTKNCCKKSDCVHHQVSTAMILKELGLSENASAHLRYVEDQASPPGSGSCFGMTWNSNRLMASLDEHYPAAYSSLIDGTTQEPFWTAANLPLAKHLEDHSAEILQELSAVCNTDDADLRNFGTERVVRDLARDDGSWASLPLFDKGSWNASACETLAPRTCALLKSRPEMQGAMYSAKDPETLIQLSFASVYRLKSKSHLHRHVGSPWRINTHLGVVIPDGVKIRVWNESRAWEVGKAFAFQDASEHEVLHQGSGVRCVLNVVSWHPIVMERLLSDPSFRSHFDGMDHSDSVRGGMDHTGSVRDGNELSADL